MKKFLIVFTLFVVSIFVVSCGDSSTNERRTYTKESTGKTSDNNNSKPANNDSTSDDDTDTNNPDHPEGIYLGIIGFNKDQYIKEIGLLDKSTESTYKSFINELSTDKGTALYFADYTALDMIRNHDAPQKLKKVALVTFTDGLDNMSLAKNENNPGNYSSTGEYLDALNNMITNDKIHDISVSAYTIGLKGNDVTDDTQFDETLKKLASSSENVFSVSDMDEAMKRFEKIAEDLYSASKTINLEVEVPGGYNDRQHLRFTFDDPGAATDSKLYIDATYRRSDDGRTLEEIIYHGFAENETTISSNFSNEGFYHFVFNELKYADGKTPLSENDYRRIMLWKETSTGGWDRESEFDRESSSTVTEDKNSALIMLVLDCTTSLGNDFSRMKQAGKDFVTTLVNGGSGDNSDTSDSGNDSNDTDTGDSDTGDTNTPGMITRIQKGEIAESTEIIISECVVTGIDFSLDSATHEPILIRGLYVSEIIDKAVPYSGIYAFIKATAPVDEYEIGSKIEIKGIYKEYYENSQIDVTDIKKLGTANIPEAAEIKDPASISTPFKCDGQDESGRDIFSPTEKHGKNAEAYESVLVKVRNVEITNSNIGHGAFEVTGNLVIDKILYYYSEREEGKKFKSIQGILTYSYDAFRLLPRSEDDFEEDSSYTGDSD